MTQPSSRHVVAVSKLDDGTTVMGTAFVWIGGEDEVREVGKQIVCSPMSLARLWGEWHTKQSPENAWMGARNTWY